MSHCRTPPSSLGPARRSPPPARRVSRLGLFDGTFTLRTKAGHMPVVGIRGCVLSPATEGDRRPPGNLLWGRSWGACHIGNVSSRRGLWGLARLRQSYPPPAQVRAVGAKYSGTALPHCECVTSASLQGARTRDVSALVRS